MAGFIAIALCLLVGAILTPVFLSLFDRLPFMRRRGHGVHSPFVYELVRMVYCSEVEVDSAVFEEVRQRGASKKTARELAKMVHFLKQKRNYTYIIKGEGDAFKGGEACEMVILLGQGGVSQHIDNHHGTSIQTRGYTVLFNNELPKQNIKL